MLWSIVAFPFGLCLGSYATTAACRAARGESSIRGRSHCDHCGVRVGFARSMPLLSYLHQGGACAACRGPIDPLHPIGELAGGVILSGSAALASVAQATAAGSLGMLLLGVSIFDIKTQRLPDILTAIAAIICVALAAAHGWSHLVLGLCAAAAAFVVLQGLRHLFANARTDPGLGFGDVKLSSALALWLGLATPWMFVGASVLGLGAFAILKPKDGRLAFGPCIAASTMCLGLVCEGISWPS